MEGRARARFQPQGAVFQRARLGDAAEGLCPEQHQAIVGSHQHVAARHPQGDGPPFRAHPGIDNGEMHARRHERQRRAQDERAVADRVLPDGVGQVDDLRVRADREHDPAADGGGAIEPKVGEERDEWWRA